MAKHSRKSSEGTSYHFVNIKTTVGKLKKLFPRSYFEQNDGKDKTNYDFTLETENGDVFTIYDWKEYAPIADDQKINFHIGAFSEKIALEAKEEIEKMLTTL